MPIKITQLSAGSIPADDDLLETSQNVSIMPASRKISFSQIRSWSNAYYLQRSSNLSDLTSAPTARTNLGLGTASQQNIGFFLQTANNLSDVVASTARANLGLGTAALQNNTFFLQTANNLSDLNNASTARTNLGLGTAALQNNAFFLQTANNLSDLNNVPAAITNMGLDKVVFQPAAINANDIAVWDSTYNLKNVTLGNNKVLVGATASAPVPKNISGQNGITINQNGTDIFISGSGLNPQVVQITGNTTLVPNTTYQLTLSSGTAILTMPANGTVAVGDQIEVINGIGGFFRTAQSAGQAIFFGGDINTVGASGWWENVNSKTRSIFTVVYVDPVTTYYSMNANGNWRNNSGFIENDSLNVMGFLDLYQEATPPAGNVLWKDTGNNFRVNSDYLNHVFSQTNNGVMLANGSTGGLKSTAAATQGQTLIGITAGAPVWGSFIAGTGIGINTATPGSIQISSTVVQSATKMLATGLSNTSSTVFTPTTGSIYMWIRALGGGGGGGGTAAVASGNISCGSGGGAGGYIEYFGPSQSFTYACGAAGLGIGGGNGTNGGTTTITGAAPMGTLTVTGGTGGLLGGSSASSQRPGSIGGNFSITSGFGFSGQGGSDAVGTSGSFSYSGSGGNTNYGFGGGQGSLIGISTLLAAGKNASGWGAGGGGAIASNAPSTVINGGNGTQGVILVVEWYN